MAPEKEPHSEQLPPWSELPLDLAVQVVRLLPVYADRARFAAVCPQWRAATRQLLPPPLPLLAFPDGTFYSIPCAKLFRFPGCGFDGYQSVCGNWLVFSRDDGCFLVDPFSRATVTLPALSRVRLRPPNAVAKWSYSYNGRAKSADPYITWMHIRDSERLCIRKLILCSPNLVAALVGDGHMCQILISRPGALAWSVRAYDPCKGFEDMIFYQGKLYAISTDEKLVVVNISEDHSTGDPQISQIGEVIKGEDEPFHSYVYDDMTMPCLKLYLVESRGALVMVCRKIWCRIPERGVNDDEILAEHNKFEVFEADFEHSRWIKVLTVGDDQVLFLGRRCSRAMSMSQYGLSGDRIFFLDDEEENNVQYGYNDENTSFCSHDMRHGEISSPHPNITWKRRPETRLAAWLFPQD